MNKIKILNMENVSPIQRSFSQKKTLSMNGKNMPQSEKCFPLKDNFFPKEGNFLDEYNNISQSEECS
jgi:hypothetical protein